MQIDLLFRPSPSNRSSSALPGLGTAPDLYDLQSYARRLLSKIGCQNLAKKVDVRWNPRMRTTAGMAYPTQALVTLNPKLQAFGSSEIDRTLRHELAHLVAHTREGRRRIAAHGPEWKQACSDLGLKDERRCHELPLPKREMTRRHFYQCPACETELSRVKPLRRKSACLACCRKHAGGRYDDRFRFVKLVRTPVPPTQATSQKPPRSRAA
jgi:SprT protein